MTEKLYRWVKCCERMPVCITKKTKVFVKSCDGHVDTEYLTEDGASFVYNHGGSLYRRCEELSTMEWLEELPQVEASDSVREALEMARGYVWSATQEYPAPSPEEDGYPEFSNHSMTLDEQALYDFYEGCVRSRPDVNVFKIGLIAAYDHFAALIGLPRDKRIDTTADRADLLELTYDAMP